MAIGVVATTVQMTGAPVTSTFKEEELEKPRRLKQDETAFTHLLKPYTSKLEKEFKKNNPREKEPQTDETGASQGAVDEGGQ